MKRNTHTKKKQNKKKLIGGNSNTECPICLLNIKCPETNTHKSRNGVFILHKYREVKHCYHRKCFKYIQQFVDKKASVPCPLCNQEIPRNEILIGLNLPPDPVVNGNPNPELNAIADHLLNAPRELELDTLETFLIYIRTNPNIRMGVSLICGLSIFILLFNLKLNSLHRIDGAGLYKNRTKSILVSQSEPIMHKTSKSSSTRSRKSSSTHLSKSTKNIRIDDEFVKIYKTNNGTIFFKYEELIELISYFKHHENEYNKYKNEKIIIIDRYVENTAIRKSV